MCESLPTIAIVVTSLVGFIILLLLIIILLVCKVRKSRKKGQNLHISQQNEVILFFEIVIVQVFQMRQVAVEHDYSVLERSDLNVQQTNSTTVTDDRV